MDRIVDGPQMRLGDEEQWRNLPYVPEFGPFELYATREPVDWEALRRIWAWIL